MRGKRAKTFRKAVYNTVLDNADTRKRVAPGLSLEEASLYYAQRAVYLRAKRIYNRAGRVDIRGLMRSLPDAVNFLRQAVVNSTKREGIDGSEQTTSS